MSIQEILESAGLPAQRGVYTGRDKPDAYYTFLRLLGTPAVNADDEEKERREMYRVTLFHKGDFEARLDKTKEVLKAAGVYINSIDAERGVLNPNHQKSRAHRLKMAALRYCQSYLYSLLAYRPQCCNK